MKFTINRSKWLRGEGSANSYLLRPEDGKQCCLGQALEQLGVSREHMALQLSPEDIEETDTDKLIAIKDTGLTRVNQNGYWNTDTCEALMDANDNPKLTEQEREENLKEFASRIGHELEFVD